MPRGGRRPGAGRPRQAEPRVSIRVDLPAEVARILAERATAQGTTRHALCRALLTAAALVPRPEPPESQ